jgi:hypothetical protein
MSYIAGMLVILGLLFALCNSQEQAYEREMGFWIKCQRALNNHAWFERHI